MKKMNQVKTVKMLEEIVEMYKVKKNIIFFVYVIMFDDSVETWGEMV